MLRRSLCLALLLTVAPAARAAERRVALLVAHPFGGDELVPLRYTGNDLARVEEVLTRLGGFAADDLVARYGEDAEAVRDGFAEATARLSAHAARGDDTLFVFYYSGHAKDGELRLGGSRLSLAEVKRLVEQSGADVRVAVIDACRAGAMTRLKGAFKGAPIDVSVEDEAAQSGQVLITASSDHEDAQESDDIQGSYFTYFLTSGLRGAADGDGDGQVSLAEAYAHAYDATVVATLGSRGGVQHPSFRYDLRGVGEVVLTRLSTSEAALTFAEEESGSFVVFDPSRALVVASFDKPAGKEALVAVPPGSYIVNKRESDHLRTTRVTLERGARLAVAAAAMRVIPFAEDQAKGAVVSLEEARHGRLGVALSGGLGAQTFLSAPARREYFPNMSLLGLELQLDNLLRRGVGVRLDLALGGSGERELVLRDAYLGEQRFAIEVAELTGGVALTFARRLTRRLDGLALVRFGAITLTRRFGDDALAPQRFATLTPGVGGELSLRLTDWLRAGVSLRGHYMFFDVDTPQSLAYVDALLVLRTVLR